MIKQRQPYRSGVQQMFRAVRAEADGQLQCGSICFLGRMEDVKGMVHDLAHQQARTMSGNINDSAGERSGQNAAVGMMDHTYFKRKKVHQSG
jgi:hypothetical protein